jgi:CBS domain containing-hemolysin-like protein
MPLEILIILALILANAVLAGAEIAVVSLRKTRIKELIVGRCLAHAEGRWDDPRSAVDRRSHTDSGTIA